MLISPSFLSRPNPLYLCLVIMSIECSIYLKSMATFALSSLWRQRLHIPDALSILHDAAIAAEESHPRHALNALAYPLVLILVRLVHECLGLVVRIKIVANEVVVAMVPDTVHKRAKLASIAEGIGRDGLKDLFKSRVDGVAAVVVVVAKVLDGFGEVAEEEDVRVADFAGDFDLEEKVSLGEERGDLRNGFAHWA